MGISSSTGEKLSSGRWWWRAPEMGSRIPGSQPSPALPPAAAVPASPPAAARSHCPPANIRTLKIINTHQILNMSLSSTSSFQSNSMRNGAPNKVNKQMGADFKTSNPQIFPSLHPLSNFYRHKNPSTTFAKEVEVQQPIKKVKTDKGCQPVVSSFSHSESNRISLQEQNKNKVQEKDVFRVPKLPKRLQEQKEKENRQNEIAQRLQEFKSVGDSSFDLPKNFVQNQTQVQIPFMPVKENNVYDNRQNMDANLLNSLMLCAMYEKLQAELYNYNLRQNLLNMYQLYQ